MSNILDLTLVDLVDKIKKKIYLQKKSRKPMLKDLKNQRS